MPTQNNWLMPNTKQRLLNPFLPFDVNITKSSVKNISFKEATDLTVNCFKNLNKKIYVAFSGGMDSEYVVKSFIENGVNFQPMIIVTPANKIESQFAFNFCEVNNIAPTIVEISELEIMNVYYDKIHNHLNSMGISSTIPLIASHITKQSDGILITGEHILDEEDNQLSIGFNEWDFYNEAFYDNTYYFFLHTPQITYSMLKEIDTSNIQELKSKLYNIPIRPKYKYAYSNEVNVIFNQLRQSRVGNPPYKVSYKSPKKFIKNFFNVQK